MGGHAAGYQLGDLVGDALGLRTVVLVGAVGNPRAAIALARQTNSSLSVLGTFEDVVGQGDDLRGRPVVSRELGDARARMLAPKSGQVLRRGSREGVDGLCDVADDADVVASPEPQVQKPSLQEVDILKLVDDEGSILFAHDGGHVGSFLEHAAQVDEDVLEVDDAPLGLCILVDIQQPRHVGGVESGGDFPPEAPHARGVVRRVDHRDFRPLDLGRDVTHVRPVDGDAEPCGRGGHEGCLVWNHVRERPPDDGRPEVPQLAQGGGVERPRLRLGNTQLGETMPHLEGGTLSESDGQDVRRVDRPNRGAVGDPVRDRAGLSRSGSGEDSEGSGDLGRDGTLVGIQGVK